LWWFDHGVYQLTLRNILKITAAWCHVKAAIEAEIVSEDAVIYFLCGLGSVAVVVVLAIAKLGW